MALRNPDIGEMVHVGAAQCRAALVVAVLEPVDERETVNLNVFEPDGGVWFWEAAQSDEWHWADPVRCQIREGNR